MVLRVATFNVENLFDRPKLLNIEDQDKASNLLKQFDQLQKELKKPQYDKARIKALLVTLKGYVTIRVDAGTFFKTKGGGPVVATGPNDWLGPIDFTRAKFDDGQRKNTAAAIKKIDADIMCMIEVEGRQSMSDFSQEYLSGNHRYAFNMLIDSPNDPRGIDVGLQWKTGTLGKLRSNAYDTAKIDGKTKRVFSRDCLEVEIELTSSKSIVLLCNHFKSKMGGDTPESQAKREAQAKRVAKIAQERYDLERDFVVVLGDLNDVPSSTPLRPLMNASGLHEVFGLTGRAQDDRWTYYYKGAKTQIDYIFVSEALKDKISDVHVWRQGMSAVAEGDVQGITPLPGIHGWRDAASDHAAISIDLKI